MLGIKVYQRQSDGELLTEEQFVVDCRKYIESKDWGDAERPTVDEVMLNTDDIQYLGMLYI